jgi:UPF0755 protein
MADKRKRRRRSSAVVFLNALLTLLVIGIVVGAGVLYWGISSFYADGPKTTEEPFLVEEGSGLSTVGTRLTEQGFLSNGLATPIVWRAARTLLDVKDVSLKAGQYVIPAHASMSQIIDILTTTKPQLFAVNVVPGETSFQVAEKVNDPAASLTGDAVAVPPEGTLLPVRYDWALPTKQRADLVADMQKQMADKIAEIWSSRDPGVDEFLKTPADMVTLASLVEKETGLDSERPHVASVFLNRLKKHMRLQTDPSVIYGITLGQGKLERGLTTKDLKTKTPYNTYQIDGLPKGPIGNPGVSALEAVAHPMQSTDLYFVAKSADPADGHLFASTYAQHRKNVALYRQAVKDQLAEDAEAAKDELEQQQASEAGDTSE